jgi:hypothetical protein
LVRFQNQFLAGGTGQQVCARWSVPSPAGMEVVVTKQASAVETKLQDLFTAMSQFLVESSDNNDQARLALYSALNKFEMQCDSLYLFLVCFHLFFTSDLILFFYSKAIIGSCS